MVKLETWRRRESSKVPLGAGVAAELTVCCTDMADEVFVGRGDGRISKGVKYPDLIFCHMYCHKYYS